MATFSPISRRVFLGAAIAAVGARPAFAERSFLDHLIARNTAARGGAGRLNALHSIESIVRITEPGFSVIGRYLATAAGQVRIDVYVGEKRVFSEGVDEAGVWDWPATEAAPRAGSTKGKNALLHGIEYNLIGLDRMGKRGHRLMIAPSTPELTLPAIQLKFSDGFECRLYIDTDSWQIVRRRDQRAYHVDLDSTEKHIESRYSDFRMTDGIVSPHHSQDVDIDSGKEVGRSDTLWIRWNVDPSGRLARTADPLPAPESKP